MSLRARSSLIASCFSPRAFAPSAAARRRGAAAGLVWLFAASGLLAGCSTNPTPSPAPYLDEMTSDGLRRVRTASHSRLWVNPDHYMGRYDEILIRGIGIQYDEGEHRLKPDEEQRVKSALASAVHGVTEGAPVGFAQAEGPCVVSMTVGLMDLRMHSTGRQSGAVTSHVSSFGSATMVFEFRDSQTNTPLIRYATHRGLGGGAGTGGGSTSINRLGSAVGKMAQEMTQELQTIVPSTTQTSDPHGCHHGILRMTGRELPR